jgi:phosphoadenosine phosphosulfate reductase
MEISMLDKILQPTDMPDKNGIAEEGLPTSKPSLLALKRTLTHLNMRLLNLKYLNNKLRNKAPEEIMDWALKLSDKRIVTTSFGSYSSAILNLVSKKDKEIKVIWCDTGYNTKETYEYAYSLIHKLNINIRIYKPVLNQSKIYSTFGIPNLFDPKFDEFREVVKLEPFRRAIQEHQPEIWFTNISKGQTELRNTKNILSIGKDGILKVSPFYYWTDSDLDRYITLNNLPKNENYFDITKVLKHRECGIHFH